MPRAPDSARDEYYCGFFAFRASRADLISCFAAAASLKPASSTFTPLRQFFIDPEEGLQPLLFYFRQIGDGLDVVVGRVNLLAGTAMILSSSHRRLSSSAHHCPQLNQRARGHRRAGIKHHVQRVAIPGQRLGQRAVVRRVGHRHRLKAVGDDKPRFSIGFVLNDPARRDLSDGVKFFRVVFRLGKFQHIVGRAAADKSRPAVRMVFTRCIVVSLCCYKKLMRKTIDSSDDKT